MPQQKSFILQFPLFVNIFGPNLFLTFKVNLNVRQKSWQPDVNSVTISSSKFGGKQTLTNSEDNATLSTIFSTYKALKCFESISNTDTLHK